MIVIIFLPSSPLPCGLAGAKGGRRARAQRARAGEREGGEGSRRPERRPNQITPCKTAEMICLGAARRV